MTNQLPSLKETLVTHGLFARKSLGQNFLLDSNLLSRIARTADINPGQPIYEVGPGPGGLTRALLGLGTSHVIAVEKDPRCLPILEELKTWSSGRLTILAEDALKIQESSIFSGQLAAVVANLPYNVGTALLVRWLTTPHWLPWWSSLTLMFQKEVAQRIVATPGSDAYGRLAILAQWRSKPKIMFDVPAQAFVPAPKVTSAIVRIVPMEPILDVPVKALEAVTAAAFGQRRKMLRVALKSLRKDPGPLLEASCIDGDARAETIDVAGFCRLAAAHSQLPPS